MLHVDPTAVEAATPVFNPHAYLAYQRDHGVTVDVRNDHGRQRIVWDISHAHEFPTSGDAPYAPAKWGKAHVQNIYDILRAEEWIAGARECGLIVLPWSGSPLSGGVLQLGQEDDGPNDFSSALDRFCEHPAHKAVAGCRKGVVFETLCFELGIDPLDPALCAKVNAHYATRYQS